MIAGVLKPTTLKQGIKLALIPLLSLVLLLVLWSRPKPKAESLEIATTSEQIPNAANAAGSDSTASAPQSPPTRPRWPKARLEDLIAFNPFEAEQPQELGEQDAGIHEDGTLTGRGDNKPRPRSVNSGKLQAIFVDRHGAAAIFDSQVIHVGDTLPSGGRVVEISEQGIKLEGL